MPLPPAARPATTTRKWALAARALGMSSGIFAMGIDIMRDWSAVGIGDRRPATCSEMACRRHRRSACLWRLITATFPSIPIRTRGAALRTGGLFKWSRSSWADYDRRSLSEGGVILERAHKPRRYRSRRLCWGSNTSAPRRTRCARCALPWGSALEWRIGTYVKATAESHGQIGDRANDGVRINGSELRAKVGGEAGIWAARSAAASSMRRPAAASIPIWSTTWAGSTLRISRSIPRLWQAKPASPRPAARATPRAAGQRNRRSCRAGAAQQLPAEPGHQPLSARIADLGQHQLPRSARARR